MIADEDYRPIEVNYLPRPPLEEVLYEQFQFLIAHLTDNTACNSKTCRSCQRLNAIATLLLNPFEPYRL